MKEVVDSEDYFYLKRSGNFDSIPACWNNLEENQRREFVTLHGSFYENSCGDRNKEPCSVPNLKKYLNLVYMKLDELPKFLAGYFATLGGDSVFSEPNQFVQPLSENNTLLNNHDGFELKPKKLVKTSKTIVMTPRLNELCSST